MRVPQFEIRNDRGIRFAKCDEVPSLMLIAGPNGSGKSTLLNAIRMKLGYTGIVYIGPHRAMRRQNVQQRHLIAGTISVEELLQRADIQGFEGISIVGGSRDPWSYDDSANYLKHSLCQIETDRAEAIAARFDAYGEISKDTVPDAWKPLRELTTNLLPHLTFLRIDTTNKNALRCLWSVHDKDIQVDIDELSSGEKSIIQMFYPLVENEIRTLLNKIKGGTKEDERAELCILIDEPELHLHPNLQQKVLDYMRVLTTGSRTQVILATHSPTMVESSSFEELFLLRPVELIDEEENQLMQVADDEERLVYLRDVFGTTSNLTSLQPIVVVESVSEQEASKAATDRKIFRALHSGFDHVTLLAGGGKSQCKALLGVLEPALAAFSASLSAVALLDRDQGESKAQKNIFLLPVAMIENFLLDPDSIWDAIQSVVEKTPFSNVGDIAKAIDGILDDLETEEIGRRAIAQLGLFYFRPSLPLDEIPGQVKSAVSDLLDRFQEDNVRKISQISKELVAGFKAGARRREEFHGKAVLNAFFKKNLHSTGLKKAIFTFEVARNARQRKSVNEYFEKLFAEIKNSREK